MKEKVDFANSANAGYLDQLYSQYKQDENQLDNSWRYFFRGFDLAQNGNLKHQQSWQPERDEDRRNNAKVEALINTYRRLGHLSADINPLHAATLHPDLSLQAHQLEQVDPNTTFQPTNFGVPSITLKQVISKLKKTYCGHIGPDFRELNDIGQVIWLQHMMESCQNHPVINKELKLHVLRKLIAAESLETFLHKRYLGQKRFSIEGLESLIPTMSVIANESTAHGVQQLCLGMAHRGRLNVLANILNKPLEALLQEFEGSEFNPFDIDGDVKYHLGYANHITTFNNKSLAVFLMPNPSHLEAVNPLVEGFCRRQQELVGKPSKVLPVLLHGDAAFIGQGIVPETFNLSQLKAYSTGGTIHIITNNQIGFTTNPTEAKSYEYCSDIAKVVRAPVLHVNADAPEAAIWAAKIAVAYRSRYHQDIVIDLVGYRKHGHNETDEPSFTQPLMYKTIKKQTSVVTKYKKILLETNTFNAEQIQQETKTALNKLEQAYNNVHNTKQSPPKTIWPQEFAAVSKQPKITINDMFTATETKVSKDLLTTIGGKITLIPPNFTLHPKIKRLIEIRQNMANGKQALDWAFAELLAFGSLAHDKYRIRLSGQDSQRGTFSSRHAVLTDYNTGKTLEPLAQAGDIKVINSPLSELACLGFEFGYSVADPNTLVLWEAQFGDFANGAQVIIDQFIVASEAKWRFNSGIVMLLPHGYEGMGPEHSSARPERFLHACGNNNIQVCNATTPAQYFHLLKRQLVRKIRKPLILMTPKSMLRHVDAVSPLDDFCSGTFKEIITDNNVDKNQVSKVILCSGKIYYELRERQKSIPHKTTAIIRCEQLYPLAKTTLKETLFEYSQLKTVLWVQEEPRNMGAWGYIRPRILEILPPKVTLSYVGRKHSGSTAEGSKKAHQVEQQRIVEEAFSLACGWNPKTN